ncbi:16S rRNA (guanine(966)-N(2))-methyltransferase RsmD [Virgibacillus soli]|uniref:16S rRNA (Guanine(966)-N(2))-methyltransferase RsmD n=2 Tax=Paracerasibacillus soli TaxID=480284 RepID=A0ABU5CP04_9BACI|nr:16S rRNA (guanine(966)-N(2))-methyltransferase RsmD [Virgibacillus soli]
MSKHRVKEDAMRVIAGNFKGRQLKAVSGNATRPTTDKVKESIFQMLGPFFDGGYCLDLFAGSGGLGIEALSRGMERTIFIDKQLKAIQTIKENLHTLSIQNQAEVYRNDAYRAINVLSKRNICFQLILLDPPYGKLDYEKMIHHILNKNLLAPDGLLYCEHDIHEQLPELEPKLVKIKQDHYGGTIGITIYKKGVLINE